MTLQPARRNARVTRASRRLFPASLRCQNARLFFGCVACLGQPCQKQPSTKSAMRDLGKIKSTVTRSSRGDEALFNFGFWISDFGFDVSASLRWLLRMTRVICLLHPLIPLARSNRTSASSVARLPRLRIRDITSDRFAFGENVRAQRLNVQGRERATCDP